MPMGIATHIIQYGKDQSFDSIPENPAPCQHFTIQRLAAHVWTLSKEDLLINIRKK